MKKLLVLLLALCMVLLFAACGQESQPAENDADTESGEAEEVSNDYDPIVLKFGTHLTDNHCLTVNAVIPWMERVTELSDGKITFEHYNNSQMGKATDTFDLVASGALDCGYTLYMEEDLPLTDIISLPGLYSDCEFATYAYWDILNMEPMQGLLADLNIKPIMCVAWEPYTISTVNTKVETLDDISKLKLRSSGGLHDQSAAALGITPVTISASETLEALQKGTVDGCWSSTTAKNDYQWTQSLKYSITNLPFPGWGGIFSINLAKYDSLPPGAQAAIDQACEEMNANLGAYIKDMCNEAWGITEEAGMENYELDQAVIDEIAAKLEPISDAWLAEQDSAGYPATEVYNQFLEAYNGYAK